MYNSGALALACAAACCAVAGSAAQPPADLVPVTVDTRRVTVESFMGLGVQWDPYEYVPSPAGWALTLARLDFLKPAFVRVMSGAHGYCLGFASDGKPDYVWTRGEAAARERLGALLWILDYAQAHEIPVMLGEWAPPGRLGGGTADPVSTPDDPRWAMIITDFVHWLRVTQGYSVVRMYNLMNEPNGDWMWPGGRVNYEAWAKGIRNLRQEFDTHGLAALPIVGPDNAWGWEWIDRVSKTMPECIGGWEMHWYATDKEVLEGHIEDLLVQKRAVVLANDAAAKGKPFFLGEVGMVDGKTNGDQQPRVKTFPYGVLMADFVAQIARAGWQGAVAWDLDDALHSASGHTVPPNDKTLKVWGFWNTQGTAMGHPEDETIRPWFSTWSLMTRLFPRGARIVTTAQPALPGFRVLATVPKIAKGLTVMLVNDSDELRTVLVRGQGVGVAELYEYRYFDTDRPTDSAGFPLPTGRAQRADLDAGVTVSMPGRGVAFLSTERVQ